MKTLKFKCTLKSDVILNVKSATEGNNQTLDFIPGNNFLGIAAGELYNSLKPEDALYIFHSGKVRFGDAHPCAEGCNLRSLRTPTAMFYPKLSKETENELYIHYLIPTQDLDSDEMKNKQLKQCRKGFYAFDEEIGKPAVCNKYFAIKSAFDRDNRHSLNEAMFGYESLQKGLRLFFEVEVDDEKHADEIEKALVGKKRIGRSRTAQYGQVEIEKWDYQEILSNPSTEKAVVYADSRLIFLDDNHEPTFQPTAKDLGFDENDEILWEESQVRTFQYAPWNFKRQCYDTDRCGIEKGSVMIVKTKASPRESQYVGSYNHEGFGKVIYNPDFLKANDKGLSNIKLEETKSDNSPKIPQTITTEDTNLLRYINKQIIKHKTDEKIYELVNDFVEANKKKFHGDSFASQWGTIRSIAMKHRTRKELQDELFNKLTTRNGKDIPNAYLTHGVAKGKWEEQGRYNVFKDFFKNLSDDNAQMALINLASEMAKACKDKENNK